MDKKAEMSKLTKRSGLAGVVVAVAKDKTVKVKVTHLHRHPLYRKAVKRSKNFLVHSEEEFQLGDKVRIVETKPLSRKKHFKVTEKINT